MTLRRRMAVFITLLSLCVPCAMAQERLCVSTERCAALLSRDGGEIVAPGEYEDIFCVVEGERYALGRRIDGAMRYGLCDASGRMLTECLYQMFSAAQGAILFRQDGRYGALDMDGNLILPAQYTQLAAVGGNAFFALTTDPNDDGADEIWLVRAGEDVVSTGVRTANGLHPLRDGRMAFRSPDTEKYGYLDADGKVAMEPELDYGEDFQDGLARASKDGKFGVIGTDGEWRVLPEYDFLERGDGIIVALRRGERCVIFDGSNGAERFRLDGAGLEVAVVGAHVAVTDGERLRVYRSDGEIVLETAANATIRAGVQNQLIVSDGDWGAKCVAAADESGALWERRDQHLLPLDEERYAFATMNVAAYYSDALAGIRYSCDYDSMRLGLLSAEGEEILPAEYLEISALAEDRYLTIAEDGLRVVDGEGNVLWSQLDEETE